MHTSSPCCCHKQLQVPTVEHKYSSSKEEKTVHKSTAGLHVHAQAGVVGKAQLSRNSPSSSKQSKTLLLPHAQRQEHHKSAATHDQEKNINSTAQSVTNKADLCMNAQAQMFARQSSSLHQLQLMQAVKPLLLAHAQQQTDDKSVAKAPHASRASTGKAKRRTAYCVGLRVHAQAEVVNKTPRLCTHSAHASSQAPVPGIQTTA
jgi:hypothetical protein